MCVGVSDSQWVACCFWFPRTFSSLSFRTYCFFSPLTKHLLWEEFILFDVDRVVWTYHRGICMIQPWPIRALHSHLLASVLVWESTMWLKWGESVAFLVVFCQSPSGRHCLPLKSTGWWDMNFNNWKTFWKVKLESERKCLDLHFIRFGARSSLWLFCPWTPSGGWRGRC